MTSATIAVPAGSTSIVVTGVFFPPYQVIVNPSWNTTVPVTGKLSSQFTITFGTPPFVNETIEYIVVNIGQPIGFAETEIANLALSHLADRTISALTDGTTRARLVTTFFWASADEALADHPWKFALKRSGALALSETPGFGEFGYAYQLPTEPFCLRVLETDQGVDCQNWSVEGREILADTSSLKIRYIARIIDTGVWSPGFVTCFSYLLASKLAYPLTKSLNVQRDMFQIYQERLVRSRGTSALEGLPKRVQSTTLTRVR